MKSLLMHLQNQAENVTQQRTLKDLADLTKINAGIPAPELLASAVSPDMVTNCTISQIGRSQDRLCVQQRAL